MPTFKTITLPDQEDMFARLTAVSDDLQISQKLYPLILAHANMVRHGPGVYLLLHSAIEHYTAGLPSAATDQVWAMHEAFIKALVDDETVRAEALAALNYSDPAQP